MKLINRAADCNIKTFIACKFDNNLEALIIEGKPTLEQLVDAWDNVLTEYLDLSGVDMPELQKKKQIMSLQCRNKSVELCFFTITERLRLFNEPMLEALPILKKSGININWNDDVDNFRQQVESALTREKVNITRLAQLVKELEDTQEVTNKPETIKAFWSLLNNLEAAGYRIDEEKTSVARLAVMISDYRVTLSRQSNN